MPYLILHLAPSLGGIYRKHQGVMAYRSRSSITDRLRGVRDSSSGILETARYHSAVACAMCLSSVIKEIPQRDDDAEVDVADGRR